ncbi:SDR family oxidoreductase [bacterium BMS3Abin03]|jgi:3-oxoacyl-[acyl-carrier protein] reductase|nr:SDR family oxidoreductase [bacterium BMS3Abin03]MCG6959539.1 SDR family oxidoreductase [bacterium BMS3Abin03]
MRLKDKVTIITGAGRGIGKAIALGFAEQGAHIVVAARTESEIISVADNIKEMDRESLAVVCDVTNEDQVKHLVDKTMKKFNRIDVVINNAGIGTMRPVYATQLDSFEKVLKVNLIGTFLLTKHAWQPMKNSGGGSIINVSSLGGLVGYPLLSAYCASKWGQIGFTKSCAEEGKKDNIRVNAIAPGKADTAIRAKIKEDKTKMLSPEDQVDACVFLAANESRYITGQVISLEWFGKEQD